MTPEIQRPTLKVKNICTELGWGSDLKESPRRWRTLKTSTIRFRRRVKSQSEFPTDPTTPEAIFYARNCEKELRHQNFFPETAEALIQGWPTLPTDYKLLVFQNLKM